MDRFVATMFDGADYHPTYFEADKENMSDVLKKVLRDHDLSEDDIQEDTLVIEKTNHTIDFVSEGDDVFNVRLSDDQTLVKNRQRLLSLIENATQTEIDLLVSVIQDSSLEWEI